MHHSSIRSVLITTSSKHSLSSGYQCNSLNHFALMSVIRTFLFSLLSLALVYIYIEQTFDHFFRRIIMANMLKDIPELLRQIRQVENEHNQLVDEYFQMSMLQNKRLFTVLC
jgi:hypothetical protein